MTDNGKIARWQGVYPNPPKYRDEADNDAQCPDYLNDDAAAMSLLDTLVEKGFDVSLEHDNDGWICCYIRDIDKCYIWEDGGYHTTRREAVVAACLEVARKEMDV